MSFMSPRGLPSIMTNGSLGMLGVNRMFDRLSLQVKIIVIFAVTVMVVLGVSTLIATFLTRDPVESELYRKALAQARQMAHQIAAPDTLARPDVLGPDLRQLQHDSPGIIQADVYVHGQNHHLVSTTNPHGQHLELDNIPQVESYNEYFKPYEDQESIETEDSRAWIISTTISAQGEPIGCLILTVSRSSLNAVTWDLVLRNLLLMLASFVVVVLVIHFFFLRAVRRPVKDLIHVMESAEKGQLNVRARLQSWDEIGLLAAHLNRMLRRIENLNNELGRKVEEATAELARRNEELRGINKELFDTQKNLARSERLAVAGQLAASLAHEIGTPLNSISGHVQLLARRKSNDESTARRLLVIEKQVENIVRTVRQLLSWTRKYDLRLEPADLGHILEDAVLLSSPVLESRKIRVQMSLAKDCPKIYGDSGYLHQVFLNLINNSTDAMPRGGQLHISLRACGPAELPEVEVVVTDTGTGIARETLAHIFDPMFTTKQIGTGAGLGLAICDQIVRQHAGTIHAASAPDQGTTFTIRLPLDCREKVEAPALSTMTSDERAVTSDQ
ncbi:MAG: ATP-binding protein [Terriglobia bacterium]